MAFWGRNRWIAEGKRGYSNCPVLPWDEKRIEAAGYRLSVGGEYFVNGSRSSTAVKLGTKDNFALQPGQFAFILTKERVNISNSSIGFISIRASIKFKGIVNVSGFQVNPGFKGNLIFAVFNAGNKTIHFREGDEIFSLWIAELDAPIDGDYEAKGKIPNHLDSIPSDEIEKISGSEPTAYELSKQVNDLSNKVSNLIYVFGTLTVIFGAVLASLLFTGMDNSKSPPAAPTITTDN
jgi:dCTP deaminase